MKKVIFILFFCVVALNHAVSQNAWDAMRLSQQYAGGTARSLSMSGAFGALGGDLSTLTTNPAGVAVYRGSEFAFTPALSFTNNNATLYNSPNFKENMARFNFSNIGYIYTWNSYRDKGVQSVTFGMAYNRLNNFSSDAYIDTRVGSSMMNEFVWNANGGESGIPLPDNALDTHYERLAYDTYAIDYDNNSTPPVYYNDYINRANNFSDQPMKRTMGYRGGIGEYAFSLGANISNQVYIGATWGIDDVTSEEFFTHEERPEFNYLNNFIFKSRYLIKGWGMNFKTGVIYRPINLIRIGAAIHTPTRYWLNSELTTSMETFFNTSPDNKADHFYSETDLPSENRFKLISPWRYMLSAAIVVGSFGLVSCDAEFVDYSAAKFLPQSEFGIPMNEDIANGYRNTVNLKAGAEFRLGDISLRGGVAHYGTPHRDEVIKNDDFENRGTISYSGGIGFRRSNFYMDAAYIYTQYAKYHYSMYDDPYNDGQVRAVLQDTNHKIAVTVGFKF
ncbi:MAG: hypothetical protein LBR08_11725 [Bacteroidales bacterium]|jgi:hypothetical protein|nr:hypothetical protein [Bacteroidales bacterium]